MTSVKAYSRIKLVASIWAALAAVYFLWEALNYRGFFGRLAELQIGRFGAYAPFLTFLFLFALAVLPALLVVWILRPSEKDLAHDSALADLRITQARRLRAVLAVLGGISASVSLGFLAYMLLALPGDEGKLHTVSVSDIGTRSVIEGPTRLVGGELGTIVYFGHDWYIGDERMAFAPYRPPAATKEPARVFVELDARNRNSLAATQQRPVWSGILVRGGLPGTARALFNSISVTVSEPHFTLYRDARALTIGYWLQAIQWMILAVFLGLLALLVTRRIKRLQTTKEAMLA